MTLLRSQVSLRPSSGVPEDAATNVRYFEVGALMTPAELLTIAGKITDAWEALFANVNQYMSELNMPNVDIRCYNLDDPQPRYPFWTDAFAVAGTLTGMVQAPEVAAVTSFQADPISGQSQARRRGRNYLGPLRSGAIDPNNGRLTASFQGKISLGEQAFKAVIDGSVLPIKWVVVHDVDGAGETYSYVDNGWINNDPDVQRRRGRQSTFRETW